MAPLALFATSVHCVHTPLGLGSKKYPAAHASVTLLPAAVHVTLPEELGTASHCVHVAVFAGAKVPAVHTG